MLQCLGLRHAIKAQRGFSGRNGQNFEADFRDQAQRPPATGHEARDVIARHILHHRATKTQQLSLAIDDFNAQHKIAHGPCTGAGRATPAGSHHATHRSLPVGTAGKVGRLKRQTLALLCKHGLQLCQRCACLDGHDQLAGFITDDACQATGVHNVALQLHGVKVFAATSANAQGRLLSNGGAYARLNLGKGCIHGCKS